MTIIGGQKHLLWSAAAVRVRGLNYFCAGRQMFLSAALTAIKVSYNYTCTHRIHRRQKITLDQLHLLRGRDRAREGGWHFY